MVDAMKHYTPEIINALANFATARRLLDGVTDDNKRAHHEANTRTTARNVVTAFDTAIRNADTAHLLGGEKVGTAGKFTIVRRGKAYEQAEETLKALTRDLKTFQTEQAVHLSTPIKALGGDSTRWPSWAWAK